jgi:hypothetical protein
MPAGGSPLIASELAADQENQEEDTGWHTEQPSHDIANGAFLVLQDFDRFIFHFLISL